MKKLMIAAAAAAMIGSASAYDYKATYTLKTTVGAAKTATTTYNLGWDGTAFWYNDATVDGTYVDTTTSPITILDTVNFTLKSIGGTKVPTLTAAGKKNAAVLAVLKPLAATYNQKSAGKWCLTFTDKDGVCYRTAGSINVNGYFQDDECLVGLTPKILDNFGAETDAKSNKLELFVEEVVGQSADPVALTTKKDPASPAVDVIDSKKGDRTIQRLAVAGWGTRGKFADGTLGVTAVNGYAIGYATQPDCVNCCALNVPATLWDCCSVGDNGTVVYGTFAIKYTK